MQTLHTNISWRTGLPASLLAILPLFTQAQVQSCPLTPIEINGVLGLDVGAGQTQKPLVFVEDQLTTSYV